MTLIPQRNARLRDKGIYLITGGMGKIGLILAGYLAREKQAKLILLGRTQFPARDTWTDWLATHLPEDETSKKIKRIRGFESMGAEVLILTADIGDLVQTQAALTQIEEEYGSLNGIFHCAGMNNSSAFHTIDEFNAQDFNVHFRAKEVGLQNLAIALKGLNVDFCLLFSSLSSILGGPGFSTYAAADLYMDAFAHFQNQQSLIPWQSVNWDRWEMGPPALQSSILPEEGCEALERLLDHDIMAQIIVTPHDLQARVEEWLKPAQIQPESRDLNQYARPELSSPYVAPRNELEQAITEIWQILLGINPIGIYDNFFELGGHSLLATQVASLLRDTIKIEVPLRRVFEAVTIISMAELVEEIFIENIEKVSDEEAEHLFSLLKLQNNLEEK